MIPRLNLAIGPLKSPAFGHKSQAIQEATPEEEQFFQEWEARLHPAAHETHPATSKDHIVFTGQVHKPFDTSQGDDFHLGRPDDGLHLG